MFSEKVHVMDHPLVAHKLSIMRDKAPGAIHFRSFDSGLAV